MRNYPSLLAAAVRYVTLSFTVAVVTLATATTLSPTSASELSDRMLFWRQEAFHCTEVSGITFPSKEASSGPSRCDDGDMTLFNGLLCAVGETVACEAVRAAQSANGRWWRSPRLIGKEATDGDHDVSFSADQSRGVLLYAITTGDVSALDKYGDWLEKNRPCLVPLGSGCLIAGWPRLCRDDARDRRCTFRPWTCASFALTGTVMNSTRADICSRVLAQFKIEVPDFISKMEMYAIGSAAVNDRGFPMHLAAVDLFLMQKLQRDPALIKLGGQVLAAREPLNPFFQYLAGAPSVDVLELVLDECPAPGSPSRRKFQWAWERQAAERAWLDSMYWDCIFMGRLLGEP